MVFDQKPFLPLFDLRKNNESGKTEWFNVIQITVLNNESDWEYVGCILHHEMGLRN